MAGRGFLSDATPINTDRIYILRNGRWQKMFRPINPDRSTSGVSLAESFAEKYAAAHNVDVGLICCADGGTQLEQWMPGSLLYDNAICQAKLALRTSTLAGVLWHQGESDCLDNLYAIYENKLLQMLKQLREDLNLCDVPILLGGLGDFLAECSRTDWELKNYHFINDALKSAAKALPLTSFVSAKGLGANPDMLHFNANSLYEFGLRYFLAYENLMNGKSVREHNITTSDTARSEIEML